MVEKSFPDIEVLVVDDEEFSRSIVTRILRKLQVKRIAEAPDGREGLRALRYPNRFHLVILDFHMPRMNGLQMLKKIRDGSAGLDRATPVAMLTGHGDTRLVSTAMALDVNAFLVKPTALEVIANRIERILNEPLELKAPSAYAVVELPKTIVLSDEVAPAANHTFAFAPSARVERGDPAIGSGPVSALRTGPEFAKGWINRADVTKAALEEVAPFAVLARDVFGPDGEILMPAGTTLTPRLLTRLHDLKALDPCVAELWVAPPMPSA